MTFDGERARAKKRGRVEGGRVMELEGEASWRVKKEREMRGGKKKKKGGKSD